MSYTNRSNPQTWKEYFYSWLLYVSPLPVDDNINKSIKTTPVPNCNNIVTQQPKPISSAYYTWLQSIQPPVAPISNKITPSQSISTLNNEPIMGDFYSKYAAKPDDLV